MLACRFCDATATCHGTYDGDTGFACDDCCGHGCEDGHCETITEYVAGLQADERRLNHLSDLMGHKDSATNVIHFEFDSQKYRSNIRRAIDDSMGVA